MQTTPNLNNIWLLVAEGGAEIELFLEPLNICATKSPLWSTTFMGWGGIVRKTSNSVNGQRPDTEYVYL